MSQTLTIARKELRSFFVSPLALIFLALFLVVTLFTFFWQDAFFRRNLADVRPLFESLPLTLIYLVSALTMRFWSDEQRTGTLELLMTLPVSTSKLVFGKFFAGLLLVALALALTAGLPITVSFLGDLDWGPVVGGYLASLLLAASYLAMGLFVSSLTSNAVIALLITAALCKVFYLIGSDAIVRLAGNYGGEVLRMIGVSSRFESIERGVIDVRDLVYYLSLCLGFLFLNIAIIEAKRFSRGKRSRPARRAARSAIALVVANLLLLNFLLVDVRGLRLDLTQRKDYSISPVTKRLLQGLDAPLLIRGYFSAKTHPKLAPLVPRIRDMLEEYGAVGGKNITTEFVDPLNRPIVEKEANEDYGIKTMPFSIFDRHQAAVVNSYFHVLVKYGDQFAVLSYGDLIEVHQSPGGQPVARLRNIEYDLTRSIKKVAYGFEPLETLFARMPAPAELQLFVTPKKIPKDMNKIPDLIKAVAADVEKRSGGKFKFSQVDLSGDDANDKRKDLFQRYGIRPLAVSRAARDVFYLNMLLTVGKRNHRIEVSPGMGRPELKAALISALKRNVPGFLKTVGVYSSKVSVPPSGAPHQQRRGPTEVERHQWIRQKLSENYTVRNVDINKGRVPGDVDVLVVVGPKILLPKARFAIDQFLMRGGSVVVADNTFRLALGGGGLALQKRPSGVTDLLKTWGVKINDELLLDNRNSPLPVPRERIVAGMRVREMELVKYPYWINVHASTMSKESPIIANLPSVTVHWASPVELIATKGIEQTVLLQTSDGAWSQKTQKIEPDFERFPKVGFGRVAGAEAKQHNLAVALKGSFTSNFKGKVSPLIPSGKSAKPAGGAASQPTQSDALAKNSGVIEKSPDTARLVVVGSSNFLRDDVLTIQREAGGEQYVNNLQFLENVVDWAVADTELLTIRARGAYARTLKPVDNPQRTRWELFNYGLVVIGLGFITALSILRRRGVRPIEVTKGKGKTVEQSNA